MSNDSMSNVFYELRVIEWVISLLLTPLWQRGVRGDFINSIINHSITFLKQIQGSLIPLYLRT
jgi:hypothetical protein